MVKNRFLYNLKGGKFGGLKIPFYLRISSKRSNPGTGNIRKNRIKPASKGGRIGGVCKNQVCIACSGIP